MQQGLIGLLLFKVVAWLQLNGWKTIRATQIQRVGMMNALIMVDVTATGSKKIRAYSAKAA